MVTRFIIDGREYVVGDDEQNMKHTPEYYKDMFDYQCHPKKYKVIKNCMELQYFGKGIHQVLEIETKI